MRCLSSQSPSWRRGRSLRHQRRSTAAEAPRRRPLQRRHLPNRSRRLTRRQRSLRQRRRVRRLQLLQHLAVRSVRPRRTSGARRVPTRHRCVRLPSRPQRRWRPPSRCRPSTSQRPRLLLTPSRVSKVRRRRRRSGSGRRRRRGRSRPRPTHLLRALGWPMEETALPSMAWRQRRRRRRDDIAGARSLDIIDAGGATAASRTSGRPTPGQCGRRHLELRSKPATGAGRPATGHRPPRAHPHQARPGPRQQWHLQQFQGRQATPRQCRVQLTRLRRFRHLRGRRVLLALPLWRHPLTPAPVVWCHRLREGLG